MTNLPDDWADRINDRWRRAGSDINLSDLFYQGERKEARNYLSSHGWHVTVSSTKELYDGHGFTLPDDELVSMMGDSGYLTATLEGHDGPHRRRLAGTWHPAWARPPPWSRRSACWPTARG